MGALSDGQGGHRRCRGRLQNDSAACGKSGSNLSRDHVCREVPGCDRSDHADGLLQHPKPLIGKGRGNCLSVSSAPLLSEPAEVAHREADLAFRLLIGLAVFQHYKLGNLIALLGHQVLRSPQNFAALLGRSAGPLRKGTVRRFNGSPRFGHSGIWNNADDFAVRRVANVEGFPSRGLFPGTVDIHPFFCRQRITSASIKLSLRFYLFSWAPAQEIGLGALDRLVAEHDNQSQDEDSSESSGGGKERGIVVDQIP